MYCGTCCRLLDVASAHTALQDAFALADDVLRQGVQVGRVLLSAHWDLGRAADDARARYAPHSVLCRSHSLIPVLTQIGPSAHPSPDPQGISDIITVPGLINVDFADVKAIMSNSGTAMLGVGAAATHTVQPGGPDRAEQAALAATSAPLIQRSIEKATGIVYNITGGRDLTLAEVNKVSEVVTSLADPSCNIIFGAGAWGAGGRCWLRVPRSGVVFWIRVCSATTSTS